MKNRSRSAPVATAVQLDRPMRAVTAPAAIVANAPIDSRVSFIGNVNDRSPDAAMYSGHNDRNRTPATTAAANHTINPTTTPRICFLIGTGS
jgi:hypothetical protein